MRCYDTKCYNDYLSNIEILKDTVELRHGFVGDIVSFYIIDNNKKHFKKKYLREEFLSVCTPTELNEKIDQTLESYIRSKIGYKITEEINNSIIKEWRCKR